MTANTVQEHRTDHQAFAAKGAKQMKPQVLGYAILVYAGLTSIVPFGLVEFIVGKGGDNWWLLFDSVFWLAFVSGALGLVLGRAWGRSVLLVAAAVSIVSSIVGTVFVSSLGMPKESLLFLPLNILPPVAIFIGALRLPAPAARKIQPSSRGTAKGMDIRRIDLAYSCLAWTAFAPCAILLAFLLPIDLDSAQVLAMLVGMPVLFSIPVVGVAGIVLSLIEWRREWLLVTMSAATASQLLFALIGLTDSKLIDQDVLLVIYVGATALVAVLCVRWFAFTRKRAT